MNASYIKKFRQQNNLTQQQLAEITGVSVRAVQSWEQEQRNIPQSAIKLIQTYKSSDSKEFSSDFKKSIVSLYHECLDSIADLHDVELKKYPLINKGDINKKRFVELVKKINTLLQSVDYNNLIPENFKGDTFALRTLIEDDLTFLKSEIPLKIGVNPSEMLNLKTRTAVDDKLRKHEANPFEDFEFVMIPHIPVTARAGYLSGFGDEEFISKLPTIPVIVDKQYNGKYRVFDVDGDSMDNGTREAICDRDKILCREVKCDLWRYKLHINDWFFVIVHKEEGVIVKQITDHNVEKGEITCHSLNPLFKDFTINLNDVMELYNVIKIVDRTTRI